MLRCFIWILLKAPACLCFSSSGCPEHCFGTCPEQFKQLDSYLPPMKQGIALLKSPGELKPADILKKTPNTHPEISSENDLWVIFRTDSGGGSATHLSYKILWLNNLLRKLGSDSTLCSDWRDWNQCFSKENVLFSGMTLFRKEEMGFYSQSTFSLQVILMCSKTPQKSLDRHLHRDTSFCRLHKVVLAETLLHTLWPTPFQFNSDK